MTKIMRLRFFKTYLFKMINTLTGEMRKHKYKTYDMNVIE